MKELLFAVMSVSICAGVITMLSPENESIKKQISFVCALSICAALSLPIIQLISGKHGVIDIDIPKAEESVDTEAVNTIIELTEQKICRQMEALAENQFGVKNATLTLKIDRSDIRNIKILYGTLSGQGDLTNASEYIGKELGCEIRYEE